MKFNKILFIALLYLALSQILCQYKTFQHAVLTTYKYTVQYNNASARAVRGQHVYTESLMGDTPIGEILARNSYSFATTKNKNHHHNSHNNNKKNL